MKKIVGYIEIIFGAITGIYSFLGISSINPCSLGNDINGGCPLFGYDVAQNFSTTKVIFIIFAVLFILQGIVNLKKKD